MKLLVVAALLVAAVSAKNLRITSVRDCGAPGSLVTFSGTINTDPVPVPGDMLASFSFTSAIDSPDDLNIRKVTTRIADNFQVPCLDGISGTCTIPLCFAIETFPNLVCPLFPPELPCQCPILAGTYNSPNAIVNFDEQWLAIDGGINGDYNTVTEFVTAIGTPEEAVLGCIELEYTLVAA
ncbi:uncharacterized protein LOC116927774 [Daphnia magna]|uniref:uncharacterized protein LOC116927774 n=1 Tax=Daphnia magna TaxID=35525 RepID=UPI001401D78A|nr:uncharacterized protein LOC116927774 [Daphnia magna]